MKRLHGMGYAQELFRVMGGFSNFAISFTIISVLSGCVTLFYITEINGGYSAASIGWPLITIFVVIVALGMAELASAYPTAGGLYYWSSKLGFRGRGGPAWGWYTGWFNLIGQIGIPQVSLMAQPSPLIRCCMPGSLLSPPHLVVLQALTLPHNR